MTTRRKYKEPAYYSGEAEPVAARADVTPPSPAPPSAKAPHVTADDVDAVRRALAATHHAEELQRAHMAQQQGQPDVEQILASIEGLSAHKRAFLRQHSHFLTNKLAQDLLRKNYHEGLAEGHADDTHELNQRVLAGVERDLEYLRQQEAMRAAQQQPVQHPMSPAATPPPTLATPTIKRSIPMAAPVSRDVPTASGRQASKQVILSPEEREIAHVSFRHLPADQREAEYAKNKILMHQLKAEGRIQGDG
jgi:hypothetical protein